MRPASLLFVVAACASAIRAQTADHPLAVGGQVKPPQVLQRLPAANDPRVPPGFWKTTTRVTVDENGIVSRATVEHSSGDAVADDDALAGVKGYLFRPALLHGKLVAVTMLVVVEMRKS